MASLLLRTSSRQQCVHAFSVAQSVVLRQVTSVPRRCGATRTRCASRRARPRAKPASPVVPETLNGIIKARVSAGAARKAMEIFKAAHAGESEWGQPDTIVYRSVVRTFIRSNRADLALATFRLREDASHLSYGDPSLSATILRACLREVASENIRRDVRREMMEGGDVAMEALLRDAREIAMRDGNENVTGVATCVQALSGAQVALLKRSRAKDAIRMLRVHLALGKYGTCIAVPLSDYNELIRWYGKARRLDGVFGVLNAMRSAEVSPSHETFEFIANATVRTVDFVMGAVSMNTLPMPLDAEVAFCGRSNVGKSSLVNMLVNRKALARVSGTPGKTQQFNYFIVNQGDAAYYLVDLPGVGYAKVPKDLRESWAHFMSCYFARRTSLRILFHLVDGRHGALADDEQLMRLISSCGYSGEYVIVLTKMDKMDKQKVKNSVLRNVREALVRNGCDAKTPIVVTSAATKLGRDELWRFMQSALTGIIPSL